MPDNHQSPFAPKQDFPAGQRDRFRWSLGVRMISHRAINVCLLRLVHLIAMLLFCTITGRASERPQVLARGQETVNSVALSPSGRFALTAGDSNKARLWDIAIGKQIRVFSGHRDDIYAVAFSPDGRQILTGSGDKSACLWDTSTGAVLRCYNGHFGSVRNVAFSPDGRFIMTGGIEDIRLWDAAKGQEIRRFDLKAGGTQRVAFSPDGRLVLIAGDGVQLFDITTGKIVKKINCIDCAISDAAFSPDGRSIVTGSVVGPAHVWDAKTGDHIHLLDRAGTSTVVDYARNGQYILTAEGFVDRYELRLHLWEPSTGRRIRTIRADYPPVQSVAISQDGRLILASSVGGDVGLWDVASGRLRLLLVSLDDGWIAQSNEGCFTGSSGIEENFFFGRGQGVTPFTPEEFAHWRRPDRVAARLRSVTASPPPKANTFEPARTGG